MTCSRNLRDGKLTIVDGTPVTPNALIIPIDNGDLSFKDAAPSITVKNRGKLDSRRDGDEMEMEVSFSFKFSQWSYASGLSTGVSPVDALRKRGGASAWVSTHNDGCSVYSVDLHFDITDPAAPTSKETLVFPKFHAEDIQFTEGAETDMIHVTGKSFATTPTRTYA
jgi:hypothetical protein